MYEINDKLIVCWLVVFRYVQEQNEVFFGWQSRLLNVVKSLQNEYTKNNDLYTDKLIYL